MDKMNDMCIKAARVYRTLNKPIVRSKVEADISLYPNKGADEPIATLKVKDLPEIKLLDLILALCAVKVLCSAVKSITRIFK